MVGFELTVLIFFFGRNKAFSGYEAMMHFTDFRGSSSEEQILGKVTSRKKGK